MDIAAILIHLTIIIMIIIRINLFHNKTKSHFFTSPIYSKNSKKNYKNYMILLIIIWAIRLRFKKMLTQDSNLPLLNFSREKGPIIAIKMTSNKIIPPIISNFKKNPFLTNPHKYNNNYSYKLNIMLVIKHKINKIIILQSQQEKIKKAAY